MLSKLQPVAPLAVRRRYLAVVPRPPLVVRRRYLAVVPRPLPVTALDVRRSYLIAVPRPMLAAPCWYLIVVPRPLPAAPLVVRRRCLIVAPDFARGAALCASQVLDSGAQAAARGTVTLPEQEKNNPADMQRNIVHITGFSCAAAR